MSDVFDPYYKWLGIPPKDQPADHYRLLGIEKFESDTEVISLATDQRMSFLRTFQTGEQSESSQQLLNEVTAAKLCLLDSHQKARYDATLRTEATAEDGGDSPGLEATTAWSPEELSVSEKPGNIPPLMTDTIEPAEEPDRQKIKKRSIILITLAIAATVLLLLIATEDGEEPTEKQSDSLAQRDESVQEPGSSSSEATFVIGDLRDQPEQQDPVEAEAEAERKANEEAERKARREARQKAREEADRIEAQRKVKEEADRKERNKATLKKRAEDRRKAKEEAERKAKEEAELRRKREEESRKKKEAWRKAHPEEYLEGLGLVKKGNSWQLKDATELKEETENLHKKWVSLKKDLDSAKQRMRDITARYKKLEQRLMEILAKLKKIRPENPQERKMLVIWVMALENPAFRKDMITDNFPSGEKLPPGRQRYAEKGPQTRDRLIEFLNKRGSSFERAQQQYLQSIQKLEDREKDLDNGLNELLNSAKEVDRLKQTVEQRRERLIQERERIKEAIENAGGKLSETATTKAIEKAEESVAAVLELKEDIGNFLKPPSQEQRRPPPRRPGGNRPR